LDYQRTHAGYDSIWVIVDRLTKEAHFIPVRTNYTGAKVAYLYMTRIVCLHRVPKKIISDRGSQFTSRFWKKLHECLDTQLNFSSAYHPQTDGQTKRTNQVLQDMLRAYALKHGGSWDKSLTYAESSNNNTYQASLKMSPFEVALGIKPEPEALYPKYPNPYPYSPILVTQIALAGNRTKYPN
jgi:transposase InsO family protein